MDKYPYMSQADESYLDQLYQNYKKDPSSVDLTWQRFFEGYDFSTQRFGENGYGEVAVDAITIKETHVRTLIHAYRSRAHLKANTNPVRERRDHHCPLDLPMSPRAISMNQSSDMRLLDGDRIHSHFAVAIFTKTLG